MWREDVVIIDLREPQCYCQGHIPGAINIPFETLENGVKKINKDKQIILYCERGGRSFAAAKLLMDEYNVKIVNGGIRLYKGKII